jgi:hypothetical protein
MSTAIGLIGGNRTGLPYVYNGPGWVLMPDTPADYGNQVANLISFSDLFANGVSDVTADPNSCGGGSCDPGSPLTMATATGLAYKMEPINWTTTSGCTLNDETSLTSLMPGTSAMTKYVRWRACIGTLFLNGWLKFDLSAIAPLNLTFLHPVWSPAGTLVNLVTLATAPDAPTSVLTALDTPQTSLTDVQYPYADNPHAAGLYTRWSTEISQPDAKNGAINFMYATSCKVIGGVAIADADADCVPDSEEGSVCTDSGWPTTPAHTIAANPDSDGDGLLDGVEIAWGSDPCKADTDNDGRTDLEEMIGPTQFLTNPVNADTDGDTVPDGGLKVDLNANGAPDFPDLNGDGVIDAGMSANLDISGDGSSHRVLGFKVLGSDIAPDNTNHLARTGKDNCGSIANGFPQGAANDQTNTDLDSTTTLGNGDNYGDACDTDIDNDSITNVAEGEFGWDATAHQCTITGSGGLNPLDPDTDGDGILDGIECSMGSNPLNATDVPPACGAARVDADGDLLCADVYPTLLPITDEEVNWRTGGFSGQSIDGDTNADSDGDTLPDGCEVMLAGTQPMNPNTDSDNPAVNDGAEVVGASALAPGHVACSGTTIAPTTEYTAIGNGVTMLGDDTTVPNSKGGRTADTDKDGILNYQDPHPSGDITYDTDGDGSACMASGGNDTGDHGPSWDWNCNGVLDGKEDPVTHLCTFSAPASQDTDGDGLKDVWEVCKWGTDPNNQDSDSDGNLVTGPILGTGGDCVEAVDYDGNGIVDFGGDAIASAKATLLPAGTGTGKFGKDGDFDLNGNNTLSGDFGSDTITVAKIAFKIPGNPCK